ncbi:MAG: hypothetical protein J6S67_11830 [Methanobrevibacter sp.]|nr:hypothetical protein [Methanobrevibacter sp.]
MVAIKDFGMPSCCEKCDFKEDYCFYCTKLNKSIPQSNFFDSRLPDCPLVEIGTCKDCKRGQKCEHGVYCTNLGGTNEECWYCADFEIRGNENADTI